MQFTVAISSDPVVSPDYGQLTDSERQAIINTMTAATTIWSWYLTPADITLDLVIAIDNSAYTGQVIADGGPANLYNTHNPIQGVQVYDALTDIKLETGIDRNGASFDLGMDLTVNAIRTLLYFNPNPAASATPYSVPSNRADALSVFLHEVGHGLGIASLSKAITDSTFSTSKSVFDTFIDSNSQFT